LRLVSNDLVMEAAPPSLSFRMGLDQLHVQQVARGLAREVYRTTLKEPLKHHWGLSEQIRRAAISIPANIAEGYGQGTAPQFARGARIALGSARELAEFVGLTLDIGLYSEKVARPLINDVERVIQLLVGLLRHLGAKVPRR
jgi:four helix bundle protein